MRPPSFQAWQPDFNLFARIGQAVCQHRFKWAHHFYRYIFLKHSVGQWGQGQQIFRRMNNACISSREYFYGFVRVFRQLNYDFCQPFKQQHKIVFKQGNKYFLLASEITIHRTFCKTSCDSNFSNWWKFSIFMVIWWNFSWYKWYRKGAGSNVYPAL